MLGVLRALHVEMPELDVAAFADERMAHQIFGDGGRENDAGDEESGLRAGELHGGAHLCTIGAAVIL